MTTGKEQEPIQQSPTEELAVKEVEGYIEQVEKQPEIDNTPLQSAPSQTPTPPPVTDQAGQVVMHPSEPEVPPIHLPLAESQVTEGLHRPLVDAFRWLAEFCVYLIKKYPGRVFYQPQTSPQEEQKQA